MDFLWNILLQRGISIEQLEIIQYLFLIMMMTPIVATIIGIARYIIGLRSLTFYIPLLITFIFFHLGDSGTGRQDIFKGLGYGIVLFLIIFLVSTLLYKLLKSFRMHYIPKLSIIIVGASTTTMILILASIYLDSSLLQKINPLALIILAISTEGFMSVYAKKNFKYTFSIALETLVISVLSYLLISWDTLQSILISSPLLVILVVILINIYVGRFLGLRLTEYFRFRDILVEGDSSTNANTSNTKK